MITKSLKNNPFTLNFQLLSSQLISRAVSLGGLHAPILGVLVVVPATTLLIFPVLCRSVQTKQHLRYLEKQVVSSLPIFLVATLCSPALRLVPLVLLFPISLLPMAVKADVWSRLSPRRSLICPNNIRTCGKSAFLWSGSGYLLCFPLIQLIECRSSIKRI